MEIPQVNLQSGLIAYYPFNGNANDESGNGHDGNITGATTSDSLTNPINYFYITSTSNATSGNIQGGGDNCSAGPVTLKVVNG